MHTKAKLFRDFHSFFFFPPTKSEFIEEAEREKQRYSFHLLVLQIPTMGQGWVSGQKPLVRISLGLPCSSRGMNTGPINTFRVC